jgi:ADP-ribose pyrophosphatase YjhB (NUDIX family)
MLKDLFGAVWRFIPTFVRRYLVRLGQGRFTASVGAVIFDKSGRILLLEHVFRADSGWGLPGGFINRGEHPEAALRRELLEEIELEVEDVSLMLIRTLRTPSQVELYFHAKPIGEPRPCSFEIKQAAWFMVDDLPQDLSKDQRRLIDRALIDREKV